MCKNGRGMLTVVGLFFIAKLAPFFETGFVILLVKAPPQCTSSSEWLIGTLYPCTVCFFIHLLSFLGDCDLPVARAARGKKLKWHHEHVEAATTEAATLQRFKTAETFLRRL